MNARAKSLLIFVAGLLLGCVVLLGRDMLRPAPAIATARPVQPLPPNLLDEVAGLIRDEYVADVPKAQLERKAVEGLIDGLDPHSAFLDAAELDEIRLSTSGSYTGVGIEVSMDGDRVTVVSAIEGSPAAAAGVRSGDVILAVDGAQVESGRLNAVVDRMRGLPGTRVQLAIARDDEPQPLLFELNRSQIHLQSVRTATLADGYGYLRIAQFTDETPDNVLAAVATLDRSAPHGLVGLVLDLRGNPGGVLESSVQVADAFLDSGLILRAEGRTAASRFEMSATPGDVSHGVPIAILVDGGTASAAEIVAGALRDHRRAALLGRQSFGKGSVQTVMPLRDGQALKLTTSLYYTPSGRSIHKRGLTPDVVLPAPGPEYDRRLLDAEHDPEVIAAVQYLRDRRLQPQLARRASR